MNENEEDIVQKAQRRLALERVQNAAQKVGLDEKQTETLLKKLAETSIARIDIEGRNELNLMHARKILLYPQKPNSPA